MQIMKVLVIGASGTVGSAITKKLRAEGHEVIAVSRTTEPSVDIEKTDDLKAFLEGMDPVDHIVCTGGAVQFAEGGLDTLTKDTIYRGIDSKLMGQVNVARFGHKSVRKGGSILLTGGLVAYKPLFPNASHIGMVNAALNGFVICAGNDLKEECRLNVIHPPLIKETDIAAFGGTGEGLPAAAEVADVYYKSLFEETGTGQEYFIPGFNGKA